MKDTTMINKYRDMMFTGKLFMPRIPKLKTIYGEKVYSQIELMFEAMWFHYLKNGVGGTVSLPYWAQRIQNPKAMNIALRLLSKNGWIVSKSLPGNNWGEANIKEDKLLEYLTVEELAAIRKQYKFSKYILKLEDEGTKNNRTRLNGKVMKTGLVREGFRKTGNTVFEYDVQTMEYYQDEVTSLVNKGIDKMAIKYPTIFDDLANYAEVGKEVVEHYIWNDGQYRAGQNTNDSRGRNIAGYLDKIGNPVGFKIMRSLLVIPEEDRNIATAKGLKNKYLFIAELLGYKKGNVAGKVNYGRRAYLESKFLDLDLAKPGDLDDLYENVWLERMYDEITYVLNIENDWKKKAALARYKDRTLSMTDAAAKIEQFDGIKKWYVPIEIDMSASILGIMGLLMNHKPFMARTNMLGSTIGDAWNHDVITNRIQFKTIMRVCYGSGMTPDRMWKDMKIPFTQEEVYAFEHELDEGEMAVANRFKDFIIKNSQPLNKMVLKIDNEEFKVECNKHFNIGETTNKFDLYDSYSNSIRRITNTTTVKRPDLRSFKRFFVTALVHNLDSQVMDNSSNAVMDAYNWMIDIHDAKVLCCEAADYAKDVYCSGNSKDEPSLERIHRTRNTILSKYFTSIGIKANKLSAWEEDVKPYIVPYVGNFKCNRIVLK